MRTISHASPRGAIKRSRAHARAVLDAGQTNVTRIQDMVAQLAGFRHELYANGPSLIDYNLARLARKRVSTAHPIDREFLSELAHEQEAADVVVPLGAQHLLHVRTARLNGRLNRYTDLPASEAA
jgi:hypothetical protein